MMACFEVAILTRSHQLLLTMLISLHTECILSFCHAEGKWKKDLQLLCESSEERVSDNIIPHTT